MAELSEHDIVLVSIDLENVLTIRTCISVHRTNKMQVQMYYFTSPDTSVVSPHYSTGPDASVFSPFFPTESPCQVQLALGVEVSLL